MISLCVQYFFKTNSRNIYCVYGHQLRHGNRNRFIFCSMPFYCLILLCWTARADSCAFHDCSALRAVVFLLIIVVLLVYLSVLDWADQKLISYFLIHLQLRFDCTVLSNLILSRQRVNWLGLLLLTSLHDHSDAIISSGGDFQLLNK